MLSQIPAVNDTKPAANQVAVPDPPHVVLIASDSIVIRGARTHNLKNIDLEIPARHAHRGQRRLRLRQILARL